MLMKILPHQQMAAVQRKEPGMTALYTSILFVIVLDPSNKMLQGIDAFHFVQPHLHLSLPFRLNFVEAGN